mgnify:CR=1 FL=1
MKKVLALVLCVAMLAAFGVTAMAAESPLSLVPTKESVFTKDGKVTINVNLAEGTGVAAINCYLKYDEEQVSIGEDDYATDLDAAVNIDEREGADAVAFAYATAKKGGIAKETTLFYATFTLKEDITAENPLKLSLVVEKVSDEDKQPIDTVVSVDADVVPPVVESSQPTPVDPSSTPSTSTPVTSTPVVESNVTSSGTGIPDTGDNGVLAVVAVLALAAGAAFVVSKRVHD